MLAGHTDGSLGNPAVNGAINIGNTRIFAGLLQNPAGLDLIQGIYYRIAAVNQFTGVSFVQIDRMHVYPDIGIYCTDAHIGHLGFGFAKYIHIGIQLPV